MASSSENRLAAVRDWVHEQLEASAGLRTQPPAEAHRALSKAVRRHFYLDLAAWLAEVEIVNRLISYELAHR